MPSQMLLVVTVLLGAGGTQSVPLPITELKNIDRDSGKDRYYRVSNEDGHIPTWRSTTGRRWRPRPWGCGYPTISANARPA